MSHVVLKIPLIGLHVAYFKKKMIRFKIEELKVIIFLIIGKKTYLTIKMILKYNQIFDQKINKKI